MKKHFLNISILLTVLSVVLEAQSDRYVANIDGMGCAYCANGLERTFRDLKAKKEFKIDLQAGTMQFLYPANTPLNSEDIKKRVDKAGYTLTSLTIQRHNGQEETWTQKKESQNETKGRYTESIVTVYGNCGMCKSRIENALSELEGVFFAYWDQQTIKLHVRYDQSKISLEDIELELAAIGHDTERFKAPQEVYDQLHACCKYERKQ